MPRSALSFRSITLTPAVMLLTLCACTSSMSAAPKSPDPRFTIGPLLFRDDFKNSKRWSSEMEKGGKVEARQNELEINVPAGATVWFKPLIEGPVLIQYEATVIQNGGPNDRASDLNCFWMARDARSPGDIFGFKRSGQFSDYNPLRTYYVGLGGNANTTTRFRRYIGDTENRPLLPEHDLRAPEDLIIPDKPQLIRLVAFGSLIQFYRDERKLFELNDPEPYNSGWFGLRTVTNHMTIRHFRVFRLKNANVTQ